MTMKRWTYWLLPLACILMIFLFSAQPYQEQDLKPALSKYADLSVAEPLLSSIDFTYHGERINVDAIGTAAVIEFFIRKMAHFSVYFALAVLLYFALNKTLSLSYRKTLLTALVIAFVYAIFDETHQGFTPGRTPYYGDVIIDTIGAFAGLAVVVIGKNLYRNIFSRK